MATITFSITSSPVTGTKTFTISDANVVRWLAAVKDLYARDESITNAQLLLRWANSVMDDMKSQVIIKETAAAKAAIAPVVAT